MPGFRLGPRRKACLCKTCGLRPEGRYDVLIDNGGFSFRFKSCSSNLLLEIVRPGHGVLSESGSMRVIVVTTAGVTSGTSSEMFLVIAEAQ